MAKSTNQALDERVRRLAENEALFREINERISETARRWSGDEHVYEFVCECSDRNCQRRIALTAHEYESVRKHATRFAVVAGHEVPDVENAVHYVGEAAIVEKRGAAAAYVARRDPRGRAA